MTGLHHYSLFGGPRGGGVYITSEKLEEWFMLPVGDQPYTHGAVYFVFSSFQGDECAIFSRLEPWPQGQVHGTLHLSKPH